MRTYSTVEIELEAMLKPLFEDTAYELYGLSLSLGAQSQGLLRIFIDKVGGVTIEDISIFSKKIKLYLAVESTQDYALEVSSPGLDRFLMKADHFRSQIGQRIQIRLVSVIDGQRKCKGILQSMEASTITMRLDDSDQLIHLSFDQIDQAWVVPTIKMGEKQK